MNSLEGVKRLDAISRRARLACYRGVNELDFLTKHASREVDRITVPLLYRDIVGERCFDAFAKIYTSDTSCTTHVHYIPTLGVGKEPLGAY